MTTEGKPWPGHKVSSAEIPAHKSHHAVWVPNRVSRRLWLEAVDIGQKRLLPETDPEHLSRDDAYEKEIEWLQRLTIHWNWEDDEGNPLPQPGEDPDVWWQISSFEYRFIWDHIQDATEIPPRSATA